MVLLDREPLALQCALINAQLNGIPLALDAGGAGMQPSALQQLAQQLVQQLQDGAGGNSGSGGDGSTSSSSSGGAAHAADSQAGTETQQLAASGGGVVQAELFDWSQPIAQARYDLALACDVLYETFSVEVRAGLEGGSCGRCRVWRTHQTCWAHHAHLLCSWVPNYLHQRA